MVVARSEEVVETQPASIAGEPDLDQLTIRQFERAHTPTDINLEPEATDLLLCTSLDRSGRGQARFARPLPDHDVLGDGQVRDVGQFLGNERHAGLNRLPR